MPAPIAIAYTHVHSMRLASGVEALVARVITADGLAGFGFTLNLEAVVAREMAAWDAAARSRAVPLHALFGKKTREKVEVGTAAGDAIDPFTGEPLEDIRRRASDTGSASLLAPNAHPWEIGWCAALAGTLRGEIRITVHGGSLAGPAAVPDVPGIGIDWSLEPAFGSLRWIAA